MGGQFPQKRIRIMLRHTLFSYCRAICMNGLVDGYSLFVCLFFFSVLYDFLLCQVMTGTFSKVVSYTHTVTVRNSAAVLNNNLVSFMYPRRILSLRVVIASFTTPYKLTTS